MAEKKPAMGALVPGFVFGLGRISPRRLRGLKDFGRSGTMLADRLWFAAALNPNQSVYSQTLRRTVRVRLKG